MLFAAASPCSRLRDPTSNGEAVRREILRDLKTDSFVSPGDQGDGFVLHSNILFCILSTRASLWRSRACTAHLLGRDPGHFAEPIIREILSLPFFNRLQNEAGNEFGLVAIGVIGCWSAVGRIPHPVRAKVRRRD